ncbi:uncharacterized protein LOC105388139 isoform X2 [Plutella xylostella]|uniref:uncharacterized protein LOC105388139 isoform X2 n=1 Tax=Plutella xylostella TaxID=51655 RepID=UPI002032497B|nr:uncharacterized protein LOC105388139 isoform X2 [Plutella xylostella]
MDPAASSRPANFDEICRRCIINVEETAIPAIAQRSTVVKYTKIPDFDFNYDSKGNWSESNYSLPPRYRRFVSLDDQTLQVSQSAKLDIIPPQNHLLTSKVKRKMVSISENKEIKSGKRDKSYDNLNHSPVSNSSSIQVKKILNNNPSSQAASNKGRTVRKSSPSRITHNKTHSRPIPNTDTLDNHIKKETNKPKSGKNTVISRKATARIKSPKATEINMHIPSATSEKMVETMSRRIVKTQRTPTTVSTNSEKIHKYTVDSNKKENKKTLLSPSSGRKVHSTNVIHVPLTNQKNRLKSSTNSSLHPPMSDRSTEANLPITMHAQVDTSSLHNLSDQYTDMQDFSSLIHSEKQLCDVETQAEMLTDCNTTQTDNNNLDTSVPVVTYDSLNIPNVSLTKEKSNPNELKSLSLPNLETPALTYLPGKEEKQLQSKSYIISRAMVTYTTKQKFDIQVIGKQESRSTSSSPITQYPLSVVSVLKRELQKCESDKVNAYCSSHSRTKSETETTDCAKLPQVISSYAVSRTNLVKPSDLISGIRVNTDCFSDQFQMELNFIDSFFESLQYLESSLISKKSLSLSKTETWINGNYDADNSDYNNFLSKLENDNDSQTMATNSLCLLNLLIRNEQKRAENLLVALKMREEALKDFTKSQILWLETKKKQDNTDISTLKKKQRGALLKLQLECGEMHRMKKALLMLSDKRKAALMKTKKNIELKMNTSVDVDKIINKKRLRRPSSERVNVPLKCFELSSSGCEAEERPRPVAKVVEMEATTEKSIQTLDATEPEVLISNTTVSENNVTVDGGFLNILFQDLKMPQIFSNGKQYEVNEEALKNILNSTKNESAEVSDVVDQIMDQMKKSEENTTTPSTARSLVDEMDMYYKSLADEDKVYTSQSETTDSESPVEDVRLVEDKENSVCEENSFEEVEDAVGLVEDVRERSQAGPLPVPVGAPVESLDEANKTDDESLIIIDESSNVSAEAMSDSAEPHCEIEFTEPGLVSPVDCEAERLRKQQMAIEKEIKALEQQQSQLLAVRSIPDKPPPPYTPPMDARSSRPRRRFTPDEAVNTLHKLVQGEEEADDSNPLEVYVKDFCEEAAERRKAEQSSVPWESCNLLPRPPEPAHDELVRATADELRQVLTVVPPATVTGLSTRRSDHIDNILFAEWRRCEPEWTSLHADEATVKNQVFESIFQKLLDQTLDEYKKNVLGIDEPSGEALEASSSAAGQSEQCDH